MTLVPDDVFTVLQRCPDPVVRTSIYQFRSLATARQYRWPYAIVQSFQSTGGWLLDWGCGNGHFSQFLFLAGHRVECFAFGASCPLVTWLQREHPDWVHYSEGSEQDPISLPYQDGAFDAVASVGVLEHVRETGGNELASLREIHRLLTPAGLFFCFHFPNRYSWIEGMTFLFPSRFHHTYRYTKRDIRALALAAGFDVLWIRRYNVVPRNILGNLAGRWGSSRAVAAFVDTIDSMLNLILNPFAQNYGFVLRKASLPAIR